MAAYKNGVKTVLIPVENVPDLAEMDEVVKKNIRFIPVKRIDTVLENALQYMPRPMPAESPVLGAGGDMPLHKAPAELYVEPSPV